MDKASIKDSQSMTLINTKNESIEKIKAKNELQKLVQQFETHLDTYKSHEYNEATLRIDFLNKFFVIFGWDVSNELNLPPSYREVTTEDSVHVEGRSKSPDYAFRIQDGTRLFFVEAKRPYVNISKNSDSSFQLKRYGWNADLPVSILSSFEYFAIYDCTLKPKQDDKPTYARLKIIHYTEYIAEFDYIWDHFSKNAVLAGSLKQFTNKKKSKKGSASVDKDFLESLDSWRISLAKNISENNSLDEDQLNFVVQQIIDRIIFLRIAEDRNVEDYGCLSNALERESIYDSLQSIFLKADEKYNSGLFKHNSVFEKIEISDQVLKKIISGLYYPKSPYEFSVLPLEILGKAYEQFLGKKITLSSGNNIKIEEKLETRKAGGVYYTPRYIVEYIVKNSIEKLCKDKTPSEVAEIKILDPASGSGSFLICAYEYLLNWHKDYYIKNKSALSKKEQKEKLTPTGELTTKFKGQILLNSIHGIDIDANAVEVTKLSLLLKCMEGETKETIKAQYMLFHERLLPTLDNNIKCGNSLIDFDIYSKFPDFGKDLKVKKRINAFNWRSQFKAIIDRGGFDIVIGNPPYVRQELLSDFKDYFEIRYKVFSGTADLYVYFFEKSHLLLRSGGLFGMICSNKFMRSNYGQNLREFLKTKTKILKIIDFGELPVFDGPATFPAIYLTENTEVKNQEFVYAPIKRLNFNSLDSEVLSIGKTLDSQSIDGENWALASLEEVTVFKKMKSNSAPLGQYPNVKVYRGIITGLNEAFVIDEQTRKLLIENDKKCEPLIQPFVFGNDVRKYKIDFKKKFLILMPSGWTNENSGNAKDKWLWLEKKYPSIAEHLKPFQKKAEKRWDKGEYWWELRACDYYSKFKSPKITYPDMAKESRFAFDTTGYYLSNTAYFIPIDDTYLLALLNSKLIFGYFRRHATVLGDAEKSGRLRWFSQDFLKIPIRIIDFENSEDVKIYNEIKTLAKEIMSLYKQKEKMELSGKLTSVNDELAFNEDNLNQAIYKLYGLNEAEIKLIDEGKY